MLNNFIYAKKKSLFTAHLDAGNILPEAVVFIEDTKEIWNHGTYFDCNSVDLSGYNTKEEIATELAKYAKIENIPSKISDLENDAEYITRTNFSELVTEYALVNEDALSEKQDLIPDLEEIRSNAVLGSTALQNIPENYITEEKLEEKGLATKKEVNSRFFIGTREEYDELVNSGKKFQNGAVIIILDPEEVESDDTIAILGTAILGKMILGKSY